MRLERRRCRNCDGSMADDRELSRSWMRGKVAMDWPSSSPIELTADFPATERFGLVSQMRRAAVSVPSNVAEGQAPSRPGGAPFESHPHRARISAELDTQLEIAIRLRLRRRRRRRASCCSAARSHCVKLLLRAAVGRSSELLASLWHGRRVLAAPALSRDPAAELVRPRRNCDSVELAHDPAIPDPAIRRLY